MTRHHTARTATRLGLTVLLAAGSALLATTPAAATPTGFVQAPDPGGGLSTAVFLSQGSTFAGHTQWSLRDGGWIDAARWVAGDFNGDGKTDAAAIWNNGGASTVTVSLSGGAGFTRSHWTTNAGGWSDSAKWMAGDFNGDGKTDLAESRNDGGQLSTAVILSDGSRFTPPAQWSVHDGGWIDGAKWVAGDFNGDGKTDLGAIWSNGGTNTLTVSQSSGTGFTRSHWATGAGGWIDTTAWMTGDFNGDGKTDLAGAWNDGGQLSTAVFPSDGTRFLPHTQWSARDGGWIDAAKWAAGDFNGDGKTDLGAIWNNGGTNTLTVSQSSGTGFTRSHWATGAGGWIDTTAWMAGDFNGDHKTDLAGSWNDADVPEELRPGQHTVVLNVDRSRAQKSQKAYDCYLEGGAQISGFPVGWDQYEIDGGAPCGAEMAEVAVRFDENPLNQVPEKLIDRAVLTYDEAPADGCFTVFTGLTGAYFGILPSSTPGAGSKCWKSGSGDAEPKPNGCVGAVGFPTVDWINTSPSGPLPHTTYAQVQRTSPREWDVSAPYLWQYTHTAPLGGTPPPRFGFLLRGSITSFADLTGEDRTSCGSSLSNLQLHVTYTVPPVGKPYVPPR